ncbi:hypothetical protein FBU30_001061 [Linnemannia zychae]|nr:hypothetical protein FBU30_001061 [Linnemannia zychae]
MLARVGSPLGSTSSRQITTSESTVKERRDFNGNNDLTSNKKDGFYSKPTHDSTYAPPTEHRYQSFSNVEDDFNSTRESSAPSISSKATQQTNLQISKSRKGQNSLASFTDNPHDKSSQVSNSYPKPRLPTKSSLTLLDTSAGSMSNTFLSRTRRASDRKMRQHQIDIQQDMATPLSQEQYITNNTVDSLSKPELENAKLDQKEEVERVSANEVDFVNPKYKSVSLQQSSTVNKSTRHNFQEPLSSAFPPRQQQSQNNYSESTTRSFRHYQSTNPSQRSFSSRQLHRVLSGPIFIPNPRGIAPTPSPDASIDPAHNPLDSTVSTSKTHSESQLVPKNLFFQHSPEQLRRYEAQLDERIRTVQENNQRLRALKSMAEYYGNSIHGLYAQSNDSEEESDYEDEDGDQLQIESAEKIEETHQLAEARGLLKESSIKQQQLSEQLTQEKSKNQEMETRIEEMSNQLKNLLEMDLKQAKEIELVHEQTIKDREQWEYHLLQEKQRREELQLIMESELAAKDRQIEETSTKERRTNEHEHQSLITQINSLNKELKELKERMRQNEIEAQTKLDHQEGQAQKYQDRIQNLERQLTQERHRRDNDQETRMGDLIDTVEEKEQDVQDLRAMLANYDELLQSRQSELNEAMELVQSLQDQLQDHQIDFKNDFQCIQDQHKREQKKRHAEIRDLKQELNEEKELNHEHQKRIELLLNSHQETTNLLESKIHDLQKALDQRNSQLSQTKSTASSALKKAKGHLETIDLQQRMVEKRDQMLSEKESRIEELELELKEAQQRHHTVVADMEQDLRNLEQTLEQERTELVNIMKVARQQGMEDRDEELTHDRNYQRQILEGVLKELDPDFRIDFPQVDGSLDAEGDYSHRTVSQLYAILEEKIRDHKQRQIDLMAQKNHLESKLGEQREQLDGYEAEIESQHEQLLRLEKDRLELEDQHIRLQEDFGIAQEDIQHLRQMLQEQKDLTSSKQSVKNGRASMSASRQHSALQQDEDKIRGLYDRFSALEQENSGLRDIIQSLKESNMDLKEAGKSICEKYEQKYEQKMATLRQEVIKNRRLVVHQEGQLFLYLSVIEKLRLSLREQKANANILRDPRTEAPPQPAKPEQKQVLN